MKRGSGETENRRDNKEPGLSQVEIENRLLRALNKHIGVEHAIGMGELYEQVYGKIWHNRINDTTPLRRVIKKLRNEGELIASIPRAEGGGYYLARSIHEMKMFLDRTTSKHVRGLAMIARMKQIGLPELLGQMQLNLRSGEAENGGNGE